MATQADAPEGVSEKDEIVLSEMMGGIVSRLQTLADDQVRLKQPIEERWLEDLRNYHGIYPPDTERKLIQDKKSRAFVKLTRKKTNAWAARLEELIFPTDDRNWGIQPTPVPRLTKDAALAAQQAKAKVQAANDAMPADPSADPGAAQQSQQIAGEAQAHADQAAELEGVIKEAKKRADAMQEVMDDQLVECSYPALGRDVIRDACRIGIGLLKGPLVGERQRGTWAQGSPDPDTGETQWTLDKGNDPSPVYLKVDPWSYFPDMSASKIEDAEFHFQRHLWTKRDLRKMVRSYGFDPNAVRRLLGQTPPTSLGVGLNYLDELRGITGENDPVSRRYVGWEYHGPLETQEIATIMRALAGSDEARLSKIAEYEAAADPLDEKMVVIHFCMGEVLKFAPEYAMDSCEALYSAFVFEEAEWSIFGYGIPRVMNDSQRVINGGWRMAIDNAALSVGPQIVIDKGSVEPQDGSYELTPRKVWLITKTILKEQSQPFQAIDIPQNITEILEIVATARQHADDETAMPAIAEGEVPDGPQQTATADLARTNGSNAVFRRVVKGYDDGITVPAMRKLYDWNMQFNPRDDIKGDMSIDARGASVLLVRQQQQATLMGVAMNWTTHPVIGPAIMVYETCEKTLRAASIDPADIMVSKDEFEAKLDQMAKNPPQDPAVLAAQAALERAKVDAQSREKVAGINRDTEMMKVAQMHNMKIDELKALLIGKKMETDSKERIFAGETAVEREMSREAYDHGDIPGGSGGYVSGGAAKGTNQGAAAENVQ